MGKQRVKKENDDVTCWNCFTSEEEIEPESLTLTKIRKEHREKLKLYSFLTSELSRPKAIPLKQRVSEPYTVAKRIEQKIIENSTSRISLDSDLADEMYGNHSQIPLCSEFEAKNNDNMVSQEQSQDNLPKEETMIKVKSDQKSVNKNYSEIIQTPGHYLTDIPEFETVTKPVANFMNKVQLEIPSNVTKGKKPIVSYNIIVSPADIKEIKVLEGENELDNKEYCDKTDNVSSNGSDSGYIGSSFRDLHSPEINKNFTSPVSSALCTHDVLENKTLKVKDVGQSMPALNATNAEKNMSTSTNSLSSEPKYAQSKKCEKKLRWSTLSICKRPYNIDDEVYSESLSSGHATLPRRSNSPLPHETELDRERFPINRSGLQARSESMASVYSGAGEGCRGNVTVKGDVQFSLLYNYRLGALEVGVKRCRDLAPVDVKKNRSDPYVKVYLLPDKSKAGKRKTKVKKNTLNPVFEETLAFVQPLSVVSARTLWLSAWHADMFGRNDFLGEVTLPLHDVVFDDPAPKWYKLKERTEQFEEHQGTRGDLIIALKLELEPSNGGTRSNQRGTLHVLVKEAKNLVATKPNGLADVFCKSYLLPERGRGGKQKSRVVRRTLSPRFEHTFTYSVAPRELPQRALELSLWDRDRLAANDFMGAVRLSTGTGTYMGAAVNWMDSTGKEVSLWETMMLRPNFWVEGSLPLRPQLNH